MFIIRSLINPVISSNHPVDGDGLVIAERKLVRSKGSLLTLANLSCAPLRKKALVFPCSPAYRIHRRRQ